MIIPSSTRVRPVTPLLNTTLEEILAEMPLRIIPVVPKGNGNRVSMTPPAPSPEARRIAALIGEQVVGEAIDATTDHAWLVVLGYFAQALGLIAGLGAVPLKQRKGPECERSESAQEKA